MCCAEEMKRVEEKPNASSTITIYTLINNRPKIISVLHLAAILGHNSPFIVFMSVQTNSLDRVLFILNPSNSWVGFCFVHRVGPTLFSTTRSTLTVSFFFSLFQKLTL